MKNFYLWSLCVLFFLVCMGCSSGLVFTNPPIASLDATKVLQINGQVKDWGMHFTGVVSPVSNLQIRMVILSEIGIKLADIGVTKNTIEVYYKMDKFPKIAVATFGRLVQVEFLGKTCAQEAFTYKDKVSRAEIIGFTKGENICTLQK